jgi:hypothetical protein
MCSLFKKYRNKLASNDENRCGGLCLTRKYYLFVQDKWAKKMSSITSRLSKGQLLCLLALFVILTGGVCIYIISSSLFNTTSNSIKIISISKSVESYSKLLVIYPKPQSVSGKEFKRVGRFRIYLDSLARSPAGKRAYDSIDQCRPGLVDSLVFIENYYKSNFKD